MSSTSIGPVSGIDYGKLITGLTQGEQSQIDAISTRTGKLDKQSTALTTLATLMTGLKVSSAAFTSSGVFKATSAASTNTGVINPTAGIGTPVGNYSFTVQRLASASQLVTQGFTDSSSQLGLAGAVKIRLGGGTLDSSAQLTALNGGAGVARGSIRVTDRSGASSLIDLTEAVDINDVVDALNSATGVSISASIKNDHLVITDTSGGAGSLVIGNTGGTTTATDLGLTAPATGATLTGNTITALKGTTTLNSLNDGTGVRVSGVTDFTIAGAGGSTVDVTLAGAKTVADVVSKINSQLNRSGQPSGITAAVSSDGHGITLTDSGGGPVTVTAASGSHAAADLGILGTSATGTLVGDQVTSGLQSPLLKNLNGGDQGQVGEIAPQYGNIIVNGSTVDLTTARTVNDVLSAINSSGTGVSAALNDAGTGINLTSNAATFTVADGTSNLASYLHLAGTSVNNATGSGIASGDEHLRYISENSSIAALSGGAGFKAGKIKVTDGNSRSAVIDLSVGNLTTVADVLNKLNNSGLAISARINDTGDGILVSQTGGTASARIEDFDSTKTAESLGILGNFSSGKLDGSLLKTINVVATDSLSDISSKINSAGAGAAAAIINDGSGSTPFRLSLSSRSSGSAGRLVFDGSALGLSGTTLVKGEDAVVVYGSNSKGTGGLTATSTSNAITGLVPGLTLNLAGIGQASVSVTRDNSKISASIQTFVDSYNKIVSNLADATAFNQSDPSQNGVLFGDPLTQQIQQALGSFVTRNYSGVGQYTTLASVGISIGQDGTLTLDSDRLTQALASNPDDVRSFFTTNVPASNGGARVITAATALSTLSTSTFPAGHLNITDGFGTPFDVDLSAAKTIGDVIAKINSSSPKPGTPPTASIVATINATGDGISLNQFGGTGVASVAEVGAGTTAAALNLKGTFANNQLSGSFPPLPVSKEVKGVGATLSDMLAQFTDSQTGSIFRATDSIASQETQLKSRQTDLATLLVAKKNAMILQFANLEVTISKMQQQGTALNSLASSTANASKS